MSTIKTILVIGLLVVGVIVGAQVVPVYFANYEFQDSINTEARMGTYSSKAEDGIRDTVFKRAQELELPLAKEDIKVQRTGTAGAGSVIIETDYTVHIDLPGYPLDLHFHPESKNKSVF